MLKKLLISFICFSFCVPAISQVIPVSQTQNFLKGIIVQDSEKLGFLKNNTTNDSCLAVDSATGKIINKKVSTSGVSSISVTVPSTLLTISGSPITSSGTFVFGLANASPYTIFGRASSTGVPSFIGFLDSNWIPGLHTVGYYNALYQAALGYTPENVANKTATPSSSTTTYPNWNGLQGYAVPIPSTNQYQVFHGNNTYSFVNWLTDISNIPTYNNSAIGTNIISVDSVWRVPGKDSIFFRRNGITSSILDSLGSGSGGSGTLNNNYTFPLSIRVTGNYAISNHELVKIRATTAVTDTLPPLSSISDSASVTVRWDSGNVSNLTRIITRGSDVFNVSGTVDTLFYIGESKTYQGNKATGSWTTINGNVPHSALKQTTDGSLTGNGTSISPLALNNIYVQRHYGIDTLNLLALGNLVTTSTVNPFIASGVTAVPSGSSYTIASAGSTGDFSKNCSLNYDVNGISQLPSWDHIEHIQVTSTPSSSTGGFGFGKTQSSLQTRFDCTNTSHQGHLYLYYNGVVIDSSATGMTVTANDVFVSELKFQNDSVYWAVTDSNTNTVVSINYGYSYTYPGTIVPPNKGLFFIYTYGCALTIHPFWNLSSTTPVGAPLCILGDSKAQGFYCGLPPNSFPYLLNANQTITVNLGSAGDFTSDILSRINEVISLHPKCIILIDVGRNDIKNGVAIATWEANYIQIVNLLTAAGIKVYHCIPWESNANIAQLDSFVNANYAATYIRSVYIATQALGDAGLVGDSTHQNSVGQALTYTTLVTDGRFFYGNYRQKINYIDATTIGASTNSAAKIMAVDAGTVMTATANILSIAQNGGNSFATTFKLGTLDNNDITIIRNGIKIITFSSDAQFMTFFAPNGTSLGGIGIDSVATPNLDIFSKLFASRTTGLLNEYVGTTNAALSTGNSNVALGYTALHAITTTSGNTAIGTNCDLGVTGTGNTGIGDATRGGALATGDYNCEMGYLADQKGDGSNNVVLGANTNTVANITGSNKILLGEGQSDFNPTVSSTIQYNNSFTAIGCNGTGTTPSTTTEAGIDVGSTPTAGWDIKPGTTTIPQFRLRPGVKLTTPLKGAFENDTVNNHIYWDDNNSVRQQLDNTNSITYSHTISTPATGGTVALVNNQYNIINPSGALLALTVNLPSSPANNDVVYIKFTQNVTTVTYGNGTVVDGITAPTAGGLTVLTYDSGTTSWY